jgi:hypothetical protein
MTSTHQLAGCSELTSDLFFRSVKQVPRKRKQAGKLVTRVNVFLNDVKRKVVKAAKTPNSHRKQNRRLPFRIVQVDEHRRGDSNDQEQQALQFDPECAGKVFHSLNLFIIERRIAAGKKG